MKKRILALLLTVCMLVLAVPVFVLPTTAAEEPAYTTSFNSTTNMPTVSNGSVTFNGNWSFVNYGKIWDGSRDMIPGEDNPYSDTWCGPIGHANWDGALTCGGKFGFINYGSTNEEKFGPLGAMGAQTCTCPGNHVSNKLNATGYPTLIYTAEKTGVIDIYFDKLGNAAELTEGEFTYLVYVNNELVKTYTLTAVAGEENWIYTSKTLAAGDLEIKVGQKVLFMVKGPEGETDAALNGGNVLFPTIEYTSTNETYVTKFNSSTNVPTWENGQVVFHGNWSYWQYQKENNNGAGYYNTDWRYKVVTLQSSTPVEGYIASQWFSGGWGAGMQISNNHANQAPAIGSMSVSSAISSVLRYTAEKSGNIDILINKVGVLSGHADFSHQNVRFGIFVNGTMVWPVAGGTLRDVPALEAKVMEDIEAVSGLYVSQGDRIEFVVEGYKQNLNNSWGGAGNVFFPTITFAGLGNNEKAFDSTTNLPVINADGTVTFNGNFMGVGYLKGENGFTYDDPDTAIPMDVQNTALWGAGNGLAAKSGESAGLAWAQCASMVLKNFNGNYFSEPGQIAVTGKMSGALRYVAEETGTVKIDLTRIGNTAKAGMVGGMECFNFYVYVNGTKIWESDGATWTERVKNNVPVIAAIDLDYGDTVDFVVEGEGLADGDLWKGAGTVINPLITWTKIIPKPTTSVNVAMTSSFALNAKVEIPVGVLAEVDEIGFLVNGEEVTLTQTDVNKYALNNILKAYAQDLASEEVTLQAYYTTLAGKKILGSEITTSILDVIQAYASDKDKAVSDLAKAVLNYVAEAQLYFDPTLSTDDLANAILSEEDIASYKNLDYTRYDDSLVIENPDATVEFGGVSMILNSATALKFYIELPEGAEAGDYALVALDPVTMEKQLGSSSASIPAGAMINPLKYTENGSAIAYFGSTFENMDRLYAFAVVDMDTGAIVSDVLVYSPLAYAATMAEDLEVGPVCLSLIALNDAIDAYTAALATR